jgi:hypothetical protein
MRSCGQKRSHDEAEFEWIILHHFNYSWSFWIMNYSNLNNLNVWKK